MGAFTSYALILAIGIAAFGLTITAAKAAQEISVEAGQTDSSGDSDATTAQTLEGGLLDDFSWGGYDLLDQPLGGVFSLDNGDTSSFRIQKLLDDCYVGFDQ